MAYTTVIYCDGGCRDNGKPYAVGAAAAVMQSRYGRSRSWTRLLSTDARRATSQRAEIFAITLALEVALDKYKSLKRSPRLNLTVYSDSKYAIGCMTQWIYNWERNGWINYAGREVVNRDLIEKASSLYDDVKALGRVRYVWIPRYKNELADRLCNEVMDDE